MDCFANPWDLFHASMQEGARRKHLERGGLTKQQHLEHDWMNPLFVTFKRVEPVGRSSRLPIGVRSDAGRPSPPLDALWCLTKLHPEPVRSQTGVEK